MANLYFDLFLKKVDFNSGDSKTDTTHAKSIHVPNVVLNKELINEFHIAIIRTKGDWLNFACEVLNNNYYIKVNLIFNSGNLEETQNAIVTSVIHKCEEFIEKLERIEPLPKNPNIPEALDNIIDQDGLIIEVIKGGGWGVAERVVDYLLAEGVDHKIMRHHQSRFDGGASGGSDEILIFIASSIASGITWDLIKGGLISKLDIRSDNLKISAIDQCKFRGLREIIADKIVEDSKNLVLVEYYKQDEELYLKFKIFGVIEKIITIICDTDYQIKELQLE